MTVVAPSFNNVQQECC